MIARPTPVDESRQMWQDAAGLPAGGEEGKVRSKRLALVAWLAASAAWGASSARLPRLVVFVSIDQCRSDYLTRFLDTYLPARQEGKPGGFRFLLADGAHYRDAHFAHVPTTTGPGHASLATGAPPALHGIIGNRLFDRTLGKSRRCFEDATVHTLGGKATPVSARNLLVTTLGDELKLATGGRAKVASVAIKDRAAVPLGGHAADLVLWLDDATGNWVTSTYYRPDGRLPQWVEALNAERRIDRHAGQAWEPLLPGEAYRQTLQPATRPASGLAFSHVLPSSLGEEFYDAWAAWGPANDEVIEVAKRMIANENMGLDEVPDLFLMNLSTNDYVGHTYGPNSAEIMDVTVRTDRALAGLLRFLEQHVPGGLAAVLLVVTADHGVSTAPEQALSAARVPVSRGSGPDVVAAVEAALDSAFGAADWVLEGQRTEPNVYLNREAAAQRRVDPADLERVAANAASQATGVYIAFGRTQILTGQLPQWVWVDKVAAGFHPRLGGDVFLVTQPGWLLSSPPDASHGSPWPPDTHVPLVLRGPGIVPGQWYRRVTSMDIAPTLALLLGIGYPSGCMGQPLYEALEGAASRR